MSKRSEGSNVDLGFYLHLPALLSRQKFVAHFPVPISRRIFAAHFPAPSCSSLHSKPGPSRSDRSKEEQTPSRSERQLGFP